MNLEQQARDFASYHHAAINQRRKYTDEPYIVHPAAVADLVRSVPHTEAMLCAAWLHDVVEDTPCTLDEIRGAFGQEIAELVAMLTKVSRPSDGNRAARKAIDLAHMAKASPRAKTIKLADVIDNCSSIVDRDPAFAAVYLPEKAALLDVLREGDPDLYGRARRILTSSP